MTRQTDARAKTSCLYYDSLGRMRDRVQRTDENGAATVADADLDSVSYDETGRMTAMRFPAGGNLWRTQSYYPRTEPGNGGKLEMKYRVSSEVRSGSGRFASTMTRLWRCDHSWSGSMSSRNSGAEISQQRLVSMRPWSFSTD